jgi:hypothetical protein
MRPNLWIDVRVRTKARNIKLSMLVLIRQNMIQSWSDKTYQRKSKNKKRKTKFISDSSELPDLFLRFIFLLLLLYFVSDEFESDSDSDESEINLVLHKFGLIQLVYILPFCLGSRNDRLNEFAMLIYIYNNAMRSCSEPTTLHCVESYLYYAI